MLIDQPIEILSGDAQDVMALVAEGEASLLWPSDADLFDYKVTVPLTSEEEDWALRLEDPKKYATEQAIREMNERIAAFEEAKARADRMSNNYWRKHREKERAEAAARRVETEEDREERAVRRREKEDERRKKIPQYALRIAGRDYPLSHEEAMKAVAIPKVRHHLVEMG